MIIGRPIINQELSWWFPILIRRRNSWYIVFSVCSIPSFSSIPCKHFQPLLKQTTEIDCYHFDLIGMRIHPTLLKRACSTRKHDILHVRDIHVILIHSEAANWLAMPQLGHIWELTTCPILFDNVLDIILVLVALTAQPSAAICIDLPLPVQQGDQCFSPGLVSNLI